MTKKISTLFFALILVLATVFSLSSCLGTLGSVIAPSVSEGGDGSGDEGDPESGKPSDGSGSQNGTTSGETGDDQGGETNGDTGNPGNGSGSGNGSGDQSGSGESGDNGNTEEEKPLEFYPGIGEVSISGQNKALLSVVSIVSNFDVSYGRTQGSVGSGVIYKLDKEKGDAYIISNFHVVYNRYAVTDGGISDEIGLYLYGMELSDYRIDATYVGGSLTQDLAVLKVEGSEVLKNSYARAADIGDSDDVAVLDQVIAIGNPEGFGISVTKGIVSVDSESLSMTGADGITALDLRVIRVDAAINEGNSGGGLFDKNGDLIGIVNAKRTGSEVDNIGYAIPISYAKNFAENIIYYCDGVSNTTVYKCLMGVTVTAKVLGVTVDEEGRLHKAEIVEIGEITENSIASGKLLAGDRIVSVTIDGAKKDVSRIHHVIDSMLLARVGSDITIEIVRGGETLILEIEVTESALTEVK